MAAEVLPLDEFRMQICRECGRKLPFSEFYKLHTMRLGYKKECKDCTRKKIYAWRDAHPDEYLDAHLRRRFGITLDDYTALLAEQAGVCAICGEPSSWANSGRWTKRRMGGTRSEPRLVVDHDHVTGEVRGLLCGQCNAGIGFLKDNATIVKSALNYLER